MGLKSVRSFDFMIWHEPLCDVLLPAEYDRSLTSTREFAHKAIRAYAKLL